jgi:hypothetical protein
MMHWNEVDWIDPTLLETHLRLPEQIVDEGADAVRLNEKVRMGFFFPYHLFQHSNTR